ncbi:DUF2997 domain-containing protein [Methanoregula sp.]|uniref:DUF2997 domain-containing protein n=1 Tax=Methanoregula sp. TaxID=2052170 RepID=UPI002CCD6CCE|nr:DUF2997 domain-containing protein [Methanoregula sp.]HVP96219.1 DUF2997 domain-containing protein [Methanoregula sp.]
MEMQEMEIIINKEGKVLVKVNGAHGASCLELTRNLENAAGVIEERTHLPAYYEPQVQEEQAARIRRS